jgi:hypothetical protein
MQAAGGKHKFSSSESVDTAGCLLAVIKVQWIGVFMCETKVGEHVRLDFWYKNFSKPLFVMIMLSLREV